MIGKNAFIVGATRGIGRSVALRLAQEGTNLGICSRNREDLEQLKNSIVGTGVRCEAYALDALDYTSMENAMLSAERDLGPISIFYNGVGVAPNGSIETLTFEEISKTIDINVKGIIYGTKISIPFLRRAGGGHIINVSSIAGYRGLGTAPDYNGVYPATKFAVNGFDESMEKYLAKDGIHVTTLMPGSTATSLWDNKPLPFPKEEMIPPNYLAELVVLILKAPKQVIFKQARLVSKNEIDLF